MLGLSELKLKPSEKDWLSKNCPYFTEDYLDFLGSYRFRPREQIKMEFHVTSEPGAPVEEGYISLSITGLWADTILYEVPVMSILSEAYFLIVDRGWSEEGQEGTRHYWLCTFVAEIYNVIQNKDTRKRNE